MNKIRRFSSLLLSFALAFAPLGIKAEDNPSSGIQGMMFLDMTNQEVVEKIGPAFTQEQKSVDILASVQLAQFIWESGYGKNVLSTEANNVFGMKAGLSDYPGSTWDGSVYTLETKEQNPDGSWYEITADFRKYSCVEDSIADHTAYLAGAKKGDKLRYEGLVGCKDYRQAIQIIKDGGYATANDYVDSLCDLIEVLDLTQYDLEETEDFIDVNRAMWYAPYVYLARSAKIMTGLDAQHFGPNETMTRGMAATVLYRLAGAPAVHAENPFSDVSLNLWYTCPILWCYEHDIVTGYAGDYAGMFGPNDSITREQLCTIIYRYLSASGIETSTKTDLSRFKDAGQVSAYAVKAIEFCVENEIISGAENGTMLYPTRTATRAECAKIFVNIAIFLGLVDQDALN